MPRRSTSTRLRISITALTALAAGLLAATAVGGPSPAASVDAGDNFFAPQKVKIGAGEKVEWVNVGQDDHTVKVKGKSNKVFGPGESIKIKFKKTGRFKYRCTIHSEMKGKVVAGDL